MEEKLFLSFDNFPTHLANTFKDLVTEAEFADVTLVSDDQIQVPAHKIVLSSSSSVLRNILVTNPHSHPLIYLRGVKHQELQAILEFLYLGEVTVSQEHVQEFLNIAREFNIKGLSEENLNKEESVDDNITDVISLGEEKLPDLIIKEYLENEDDLKNIEDTGSEIPDLNIEICDDTKADLKLVTKPLLPDCDDCPSALETKDDLQIHCKSEHEGMQVADEEVESTKKFHRSQSLKNNPKTVNAKYSCDECERLFPDQNTFNRHKKYKHPVVVYTCNMCEYQSKSQSSLRQHQRSKHESGVYYCDQCEYKAANRANLWQHQQCKHMDIKYSCNHCDYHAPGLDALHKHQQSKHWGVIYTCSQCDYKTAWQAVLKTHERTKHAPV